MAEWNNYESQIFYLREFDDDEEDEEFYNDVKNNISEYASFFAKVRKGEVWNEEMGKAAIQKIGLGCSDINCCDDAVTSNIPILEIQTLKNIIPSASEANKMTNNAIWGDQLDDIGERIRKAIKEGKFYFEN